MRFSVIQHVEEPTARQCVREEHAPRACSHPVSSSCRNGWSGGGEGQRTASSLTESAKCPGAFVLRRSSSRGALGQRREQVRNSPLSISLKSRTIKETLLNSARNRDVDSSLGFLAVGLTNCTLALAFLCPENTASGGNRFHGNLKLTYGSLKLTQFLQRNLITKCHISLTHLDVLQCNVGFPKENPYVILIILKVSVLLFCLS